MSRHPSARLVYGVWVVDPISNHILDKVGYDYDQSVLAGLFEEYASKYDLEVAIGYSWEDPSYVIVGKNTKSFSASEEPSSIATLPDIDADDQKNLLAIASDLGLGYPSWWLVPFYG